MMQCSHSQEAVVRNIDLVTEILLWLPVKSLIRFQCVSKQWLALISDPRFRHNHTRRLFHTPLPCTFLLPKPGTTSRFQNQYQIVPLINSDSDPPPFRTLQFDYVVSLRGFQFRIIQSCNGLLLCCTSQFSLRFPLYWYNICNPTTKQFVNLRIPRRPSKKFGRPQLYLAFDPLRSPHYKVISICKATSDKNWKCNVYHYVPPTIWNFQIDVYSSETGSWSEDVASAPQNLCVDSGVYCSGVVYWYNLGDCSLYFDVHQQCLKPLPHPDSIDNYNNTSVRYFGESRGHLHLILTNSDGSLDFDILELKEDYSGWFVRYHVDFNPMRAAIPELKWGRRGDFNSCFVFAIVHQARDEDSILVLFVDDTIMSYNLMDHSSRRHHDVEALVKGNNRTFTQLFVHFENLSFIEQLPK